MFESSMAERLRIAWRSGNIENNSMRFIEHGERLMYLNVGHTCTHTHTNARARARA